MSEEPEIRTDGTIEVRLIPIAIANYQEFLVPFRVFFFSEEFCPEALVETYMYMREKINFVEMSSGVLIPCDQVIATALDSAKEHMTEERYEVMGRLLAYGRHLVSIRDEAFEIDATTVEAILEGRTLQ